MKNLFNGETIVKVVIGIVFLFASFTGGRIYETGWMSRSRAMYELSQTGEVKSYDNKLYYRDGNEWMSYDEFNNLRYLSKYYDGVSLIDIFE